MSIESYGKIYNLGHRNLADLFSGPVSVEEKIDGSQFSFSLGVDGVLRFRSKNVPIETSDPGMFSSGVESIVSRQHMLTPGWVYRGEYLAKPKHNTLAYERVPAGFVMIFDIDTGGMRMLGADERASEVTRIGLEPIPVIHVGMVSDVEKVHELLTGVSVLGGNPPEGLVFKNYALLDPTYGKILMGKHVRPEFREHNANDFRRRNPHRADIVAELGEKYRTETRWIKAVQRLAEEGRLTSSPADIGPLLEEARNDVKAECYEQIAEALAAHAWKSISRQVVAGLPEWYKQRLLSEQFDKGGK